jgi:hypothetical protein
MWVGGGLCHKFQSLHDGRGRAALRFADQQVNVLGMTM